MWAEEKCGRFQQLRQLQQDRQLSDAEQAELALLVKELEAEEAAYLTPAAEQLRQERETIEGQNRSLENLVRRREALVQRLRDFLAETQAEQRTIASELTAVLAGGRDSNTDG